MNIFKILDRWHNLVTESLALAEEEGAGLALVAKHREILNAVERDIEDMMGFIPSQLEAIKKHGVIYIVSPCVLEADNSGNYIVQQMDSKVGPYQLSVDDITNKVVLETTPECKTRLDIIEQMGERHDVNAHSEQWFIHADIFADGVLNLDIDMSTVDKHALHDTPCNTHIAVKITRISLKSTVKR